MILNKIINKKEIENLKKSHIYEEITNTIEQEKLQKNSKKILKEKIKNLFKKERDSIRKKIVQTEFINPWKMTSIDSKKMQKLLAKMIKNNCEAVVVEMSSQGLEQNRHWGVGKFDYAGFLNLHPEHIEAHGSFENYKNCKAILFRNLKPTGTVVVNEDDENSNFFLLQSPKNSKKYTIKQNKSYSISPYSINTYKNFEVDKQQINSYLIADFEVTNIVLASTITSKYLKDKQQDFDYSILEKDYYNIPGRMEWVVKNNQIID